MESVTYQSLTDRNPWIIDDWEAVEKAYEKLPEITKHKLIVLDDDPTGIQSVHDVLVYTELSYESVLAGFKESTQMFFLLTNSRALSESQTEELHLAIGRWTIKASKATGIPFILLSRGDSTLRGHYPLETQCLQACMTQEGITTDGEIVIPFFKAGGRLTADNVHYVRYGDQLIPAGETEFAKDKTFGYTQSDLTKYIEEKTEGLVKAKDVLSIDLKTLRKGDIDSIERDLIGAENNTRIIVNALDEKDLIVFAIALDRAIGKGKRFIFRVASDFVKVIGRISAKSLLTKEVLGIQDDSRGGLVIVGSYTDKTTSQLNALTEIPNLSLLEFDSDQILTGSLETEIQRAAKQLSDKIASGNTAVLYTKRKLLFMERDSKADVLARSVQISEGLVEVVRRLSITPSFILAKGGITSSDIGVKALGVKRALVFGQIQPGVPVWKTDSGSLFPGIPYIIFPGNVGDGDTLKRIILELDYGKGTGKYEPMM